MILLAIALAGSAPALAQPAPATPEARAAIAEFGQCVASRSAGKAHDVLTMDFRSREYRQGLRALSDTNRDCYRNRSTMRAGGLPFAAALAEALLRAGEDPLNVRLLRAARAESPTFAPSDRVAMCVARSDADHAAALLTAPIASDAERQAAAALSVAVRRCTPKDVVIDLQPFALRSILATASYRLLAHASQSPSGRD